MIFGQIQEKMDDKKVYFQNAFDKFYNPMKLIPFFGEQYNTIITLLIAVTGILSLFLSAKNVVNRILKRDQTLDQQESEKLKRGEQLFIQEFEKFSRKKKFQELITIANRISDTQDDNQLQNQLINNELLFDPQLNILGKQANK